MYRHAALIASEIKQQMNSLFPNMRKINLALIIHTCSIRRPSSVFTYLPVVQLSSNQQEITSIFNHPLLSMLVRTRLGVCVCALLTMRTSSERRGRQRGENHSVYIRLTTTTTTTPRVLFIVNRTPRSHMQCVKREKATLPTG